METHEKFALDSYAVVRSLLDAKSAAVLNDFAQSYATSGTAFCDAQVPGTPAIYGAPLMERMLRRLVPAVEKASGKKLFPTYSYFRVYKRGDALKRHKDREACEISVSVCLGYRAAETWPLFVEGPAGVFAAKLEPGDGLLYKGTECDHWREPFEGESAAQVFFHYVDQNGPYAEWQFDKRLETDTVVAPVFGQHAPVR
jgi:hypothetical protein